MDAIDLHDLRPDEAGPVCELVLGIPNGEYGMALTLQELPDLVDAYRTYVASGTGQFWVAVAGGAVVGCIGVLKLDGTDHELRRMYVDPAHRGRGIAQRLLERAMGWCARHGVGALYLETNERWKAAHHLYAKRGFQPVAREALPAAFPVVRVATGFYRFVFPPEPVPTVQDLRP